MNQRYIAAVLLLANENRGRVRNCSASKEAVEIITNLSPI
jgi:hypothetical protein